MSTRPATDRVPRVILLGVSCHPRSVAAIRSLGGARIPLVGLQRPDVHQPPHSRFLRTSFRVRPDPDELLPFLQDLGRSGGGVVMALDDDYLVQASKHAGTLSSSFTLTMPSWEILGPLMEHATLYRAAAALGLATPRVFTPRNERELREVVASLDLRQHQYLLKATPGIGPADPATGRSTRLAGGDCATIEANCRDIHARLGEYPLIAEVMPGEASDCIGVSLVLNPRSEPVLAFAVKRLRLQSYVRGGFVHPYELGSNVYCESVRDDEAIDASTRLAKAMAFTGTITFEFRRRPGTGELVLVKGDPRFVRATSLSTALGMDVPLALYRVVTSAPVDLPAWRYPEGVAWLWGTKCLESIWVNRHNSPVRRELLAIAGNLHRVKAFAHASLRDPLPCVMHVGLWSAFLVPRRVGRGLRAVLRAIRPRRTA